MICEVEGVGDPDRLAWEPSAGPDLRWLVQQSKSAMVVPSSRGGVSDDSLSGFGAAPSAAFRESTKIEPHFEKVASADADERHLFIPLHDSALPFGIGAVLMFGETPPSQPPRVPDHITHLWLAPAFSRRVLLWSRVGGWRNVFPYDSPRGGGEGATDVTRSFGG